MKYVHQAIIIQFVPVDEEEHVGKQKEIKYAHKKLS